jgi:hypothetical protein
VFRVSCGGNFINGSLRAFINFGGGVMLSRFRVPWFNLNNCPEIQSHPSRSDKIVRQAWQVSQANAIWRYSVAVLAVAAAAGLLLVFHRVLGL